MSRFDALPDNVHSKLKTDIRYISGDELLPAEVAKVMYTHERPIWTASQMRNKLESSHGKETVRKKLGKLEELGICDSMEANNGRIYWLDTEQSHWPLPPDIEHDDELRAELAEMEDELETLQQENTDLQETIVGLQDQIAVLQDQLTLREALKTEYIQFVLLGLVTGFASALVFALATLQAVESIQTPFSTGTFLVNGLFGLLIAVLLILLSFVSGAFAYTYGKPIFSWLGDLIMSRLS